MRIAGTAESRAGRGGERDCASGAMSARASDADKFNYTFPSFSNSLTEKSMAGFTFPVYCEPLASKI